MLGRLFEPFFSTKPPGSGSGIGLATARGIIRSHGGELRVASELGHGACFRAWLPSATVSPRAEGPGVLTAPCRRAVGAGRVLLVADDTELVRRALSNELEEIGFRVLQAEDGVSALELVRARVGELSGAVLDCQMPRMAGRRVASEIRALRPGLPVVLMSGFVDSVSRRDEEGFEVVDKPFSIDELLDRLHLSEGGT